MSLKMGAKTRTMATRQSTMSMTIANKDSPALKNARNDTGKELQVTILRQVERGSTAELDYKPNEPVRHPQLHHCSLQEEMRCTRERP